jgi:hypothetical protein
MKATAQSVVEDLKRVHEKMRGDFRYLEELFRKSPGPSAAELISRLVEARADVAEHFRFEEENGYLDVVRLRDPNLERAIDHLLEEHRQLLGSLDALIAIAGASLQPDEALRQRVLDWIGQLRRHEVRENQLVQDCFNIDISAED